MNIRKLKMRELSLMFNLSGPTIEKMIRTDSTFPVSKQLRTYYVDLDKVGSWLDTYIHSKQLKITKTYKNYKIYMDGKYPAILLNNKNVHIHRLVWEENNGKIPKGYVIHHKDENKMNWDISNLELLSRAEHIKIHNKDFNRKKVAVLAKKGKTMKRFESIKEAALYCKTQDSGIRRCFIGKQKKANGWQFYKIGGDSYSVL